MRKKYKRTAKAVLIQKSVITIMMLALIGFVYGGILPSILLGLSFMATILFDYLCDREIDLKISIPIFVILISVITYLVYTKLLLDFEPRVLAYFIIIAIFLGQLFHINYYKVPPFVIDGFIDEVLMKEYIQKYTKKMYKLLGISLVLLVILYFTLPPLLDYILKLVWLKKG